jgi:hypothetical protein
MSEQSWREYSLDGLRHMAQLLRLERRVMQTVDPVKAGYLADAIEDLQTVILQLEAEAAAESEPTRFSDRRAYVPRRRTRSNR